MPEPSGTAGKPILGQLNRNELTDTLIIVVRYFGGVKLGTSGLQNAYKQAAGEALANAVIEERTVDVCLAVHFEYPLMNEVMRVIKDIGYEPNIYASILAHDKSRSIAHWQCCQPFVLPMPFVPCANTC